jgi:hypothetical protein
MTDQAEFFKHKYYPRNDGVTPVARARPDRPDESKPWSWKTYDQIVDQGLIPELRVNMASFVDPERRENYRKYLISHCDFPDDWNG